MEQKKSSTNKPKINEETPIKTEDKKLKDTKEDEFIDEAVKFINETSNKTIYRGSLEIGRYLLEKFFDNDIELASSRNPRKRQSYNRLCEREDLSQHPTTLAKMLRVAAQEHFLTENKVKTDGLTYTHKAELLPLANSQDKIDLIDECLNEDLSTRKLQNRVKERTNKDKSYPKLSPTRKTERMIKKTDSFVEAYKNLSLENSLDQIDNMKKTQKKKLKKNLADLKSKIINLQDQENKILETCDKFLDKLKEEKKD